MAGYETIPKEDAPLQPPKHKSPKFAATVAAICTRAASPRRNLRDSRSIPPRTGLASAVAGTQAPAAMMALSRYFSAGERLQLAHYRQNSRKDSMCLAVEDNRNVRQSDTNVIVYDCEEPNGKTWKLDRSRSSGRSWFQIKYTGPTQESFDLCVAGQRPGQDRDFGSGSQFYLWRCLEDDRTQQFRWTGRRPNSGGYALAWRQDSDLCLDAKRFSNGDPVIAYECSRNLLDHQIWATL